MSIETDLVTHLKAQASLTAIIGQKLAPLEGEEGWDSPFLIYEILSRPRDQSQSGETGLVQMLVKLQCFASNYPHVRQVEKALRAIFYRFQHRSMESSYVQWAKLTDAQDADQPPIFKDQFGVWQGIWTLKIWYEEPVPAEC